MAPSSPPPPDGSDEDDVGSRPPIVGSWRNAYLVVLLALAIDIALLALLTWRLS